MFDCNKKRCEVNEFPWLDRKEEHLEVITIKWSYESLAGRKDVGRENGLTERVTNGLKGLGTIQDPGKGKRRGINHGREENVQRQKGTGGAPKIKWCLVLQTNTSYI